MISRITTAAFAGTDVMDIDVQVQISHGIVCFNVVGLPDKAVAESRDRVRAALHAIGLSLPTKRIIINLAPADVLKEGSHFDLPIALALLGSMGVLPAEEIIGYTALGELGLDGAIAPVTGVLPAAVNAAIHNRGIICPEKNGAEAVWAGDLEVLAAPSLLSLINHFKGTQVLTRPTAKMEEITQTHAFDLRDIKGQESAKRALEVAASGGHNLLMVGPPGSGKSMLASRLTSILPPLEPDEALEVSMIHSIGGLLDEGKLLRARPYRDPHHSASLPALIGGGLRAKPGEISLAHNGVLFLDELPEFQRPTLEALRQPLETGRAVISRANNHVTYPAKFQLVAAMNPCRCGYVDDASRTCGRAPRCAMDYQSKISGPMFDRIDCHIDVPAVSARDLSLPPPSEDSKTVALRVAYTRHIQRERFAEIAKQRPELPKIRTNAEVDGELLEKISAPNQAGRKLLTTATEKFKLSARGYHRVLRLARTLADMQGAEFVDEHNIAEALTYRRVNMGQ